MRRVHLFEIEDQPWCPEILRDAATAYISEVVDVLDVMSGAMPHLRRALEAAPERRIIDLCSGAGGPARLMLGALEADGLQVQVHCTDLFPNLPALAHAARAHPALSYSIEPVDATAVPAELIGVRTLFNAFHHFRPEAARRILEDAVRSGQPIAIFEFVGRVWQVLPGMVGVPLGVMALLPRLRPFRWQWIPLTYVVPVIPAFVLWDGLVSCLRVYGPPELYELTDGLDAFDWTSGRFALPKGLGSGTYLLGVPAVA